MYGLHALVIVVADAAELLIESGQLGEVFLRFLINLYDLELSPEDAGEDKFGLVLQTGLFVHGEEPVVLLLIQTHGIAVYPWVCKHCVPRFVADGCFLSHQICI